MNLRATDRTGRTMTRLLSAMCLLIAMTLAPGAVAQGQNAAPPPPEVVASPRATLVPVAQPPAPVAATPDVATTDGAASKPLSLLTMDPAAPEMSSLPGGVSPAFGQVSTKPGDWRFDYHGLLFVPLRIGFNTRLSPARGQAKTVLHTPPITPED